MADRRPRVGILGAGALGTLFGWHVAAVADVAYLDIQSELCARIERDGVRLEGAEPRAVHATVEPSRLFGSEMLFVFVKAHDTLRALRPFAGRLDPSAAIVSVQNGIGNEEAIKTALGGSVAVVIGATTESALAVGDGITRRLGTGRTVLGSAGATAATVERVVGLLVAAGFDARGVYDIRPHLWGKLIANAAINPTSALLGAPSGIILTDPDAAALARAIALEAAAVARGSGVQLLFADPWTYVREIAERTAHVENSMALDLGAGRRTEIDHINGAVVAAGRRLGVATPYNETLTRMIKAAERKERVLRS
ncbi:MAG: 2-dehydropantoate 2-reductase [Candidatus Eremiobacteraeota bacterium]|nr:2-dehydropantoate 2-reductase [Candidatus Eremiobacteraeota bacterium]